MKTAALLIVSNVFMTIAWYGHLRHKSAPLAKVVLISWLIAFVEYWFAVPANRIGHGQFTAAQLKTMQEIISLSVFAVFSIVFLHEKLTWNCMAAFVCLALAGCFMFMR
ncbi:MAG: DMT family protein [Elusimicrobiaceae bacterium]|nr:DMT family protein [Elusimicrobiaceae bacterium]